MISRPAATESPVVATVNQTTPVGRARRRAAVSFQVVAWRRGPNQRRTAARGPPVRASGGRDWRSLRGAASRGVLIVMLVIVHEPSPLDIGPAMDPAIRLQDDACRASSGAR